MTTALAHENGRATAAVQTPSLESRLRQFTNLSDKAESDLRWLGNYNPQWVGFRIRKMMMMDPIIAFGIAIHRAAITNMRYAVESRDPEIRAFLTAMLEGIFGGFALGISNAIPYGWAVDAKVWAVKPLIVDVDAGKGKDTSVTEKSFPHAWIIERLKAIPLDTLTLMVDPERDAWGGVKQSGNDKPVGPDKAVLWSNRSEEVFGRLTGLALLDQVYEPWWFGAANELLTNRYFERTAGPSIVGRGPRAAYDENGKLFDGYEWIMEQALALRSGGAVVLDSKTDEHGKYLADLGYLTDGGMGRGEMFGGRNEALDRKKLRGLLITDRVMASGAGGLGTGDSELQADVLALFMEATQGEFLGTVMNPQVVNQVILLNFGEERLLRSRTRVVASGLSQGMRDMLKDVLKITLQNDQLKPDGSGGLQDRLDTEAIAKSLSLPLRAADETEDKPKGGADEGSLPETILTEEGKEAAAQAFRERGVTELPGMEPPPAGTQEIEVSEEAVLNGAQITAATAIVVAVAAGEIHRDSGIGQLIVLFNLTPEQAEQIMGSAGTSTPTTPSPNPKAEAEAEAKAAEAAERLKQQVKPPPAGGSTGGQIPKK